jgi:hypothetical protein
MAGENDTGNSENRPGNSAAPKSGTTTTTTTTGPGSESVSATIIKGVLEGLKGLIQPAIQTATALDGLRYSSSVASSVMKDAFGSLPLVGGSLKGFIGSLDDSRKEVNSAAKAGLGGLDMTGLSRDMKTGRLSVTEYLAEMKKFGGGLQGLGGSVNQTGQNLIEMGKNAREGKFGSKLTDYGMTLDKEMVHIQAIGSLGVKSNAVATDAQRKNLAEANGKLALEILNQAKLTGKSTEAISGELEERLRQPEVMARMRLMNEDQRRSFILTQAQLTGMGESAQKAQANLAAGGKPTQETIAFLQTMKDGGAMFRRGTALATRGKTEDDRAAGRALLERSQVEQAKYQATPEYQRQMTTGDARGEAFKKAYQENQMGQRIVEILEKNPSLTSRQALQQARKQAEVETVGDKGKGVKPSAPPPGSEIQRAANRTEDAALKMNQNTATAIDNYAKTAKGAQDLAAGFDNIRKVMFETETNTKNAVDELKKFSKEMREFVGGKEGAAPAKPNTGDGTVVTPPKKTEPNSGTVAPAPKKDATPAATPKKDATPAPAPAPVVANPTNTTPATVPVPKVEPPTVVKPKVETPEPTTGTVGPPPKISRKHTSLNETGSLIDNFSSKGTSVLAHQGEGVVNLAQLNNLASGSKNIGIETALASMQSMFSKNTASSRPTVNDQPAVSKGNVDVAKMFEGVNTKVSSINTPKVDYNPSEYVNSTLKTPPAIEEPKTTGPTTASIPQSPVVSAETISLKDLNEQLMRLNTGIMQLVQHSAKSIDLNEAQVKATKSLSGNKFA